MIETMFINNTEKIKVPYLIQTWKLSENRKGNDLDKRFDGHFLADYMGSAEFEFGTLPACLEYIKKNFSEYGEIYSNENFFWIGPKKEGIEKYGDFLNQMKGYKIRLKEYVFTNAKRKNGSPIPYTSVMRAELGMDIENCVLFSEKKYIIAIAQKAIQYNIEHPLNIRIEEKIDSDLWRKSCFCEDMINNDFLKKEFAGKTISIEKLVNGEWVFQKELVVDALEKDLKVVVEYLTGKVEEDYGNKEELQKLKEYAVSIRYRFKRFQAFELRDGNWVQVYDWKR